MVTYPDGEALSGRRGHLFEKTVVDLSCCTDFHRLHHFTSRNNHAAEEGGWVHGKGREVTGR